LTLKIAVSKDAASYMESLDKTLCGRVKDKIRELSNDPFNIRLSKPLKGSGKRTARVGSYRILFVIIDGNVLFVSDVGPRGKIYRKA
jgi:mRNA-degrading endonuclease RelE of RelBE toxin-antitoxin system